MGKVIVVIPVHKEVPSAYELISFKQCIKILGNHPISILAPKELNLNVYKTICPTIIIKTTAPKWFESVKAYNDFKKHISFYTLFKKYEFILTYELDAFVFSDDLLFWCNKGYDYIGAPWFENFALANSASKLIGVGNSGFSLRKNSSLQWYISRFIQKSTYYHSRNILLKVIGIFEYYFSHLLSKFNYNSSILKYSNEPEDFFICYRLKSKFSKLNIAPIEQAIKFSFEVNPEILFQINNETLPFGCHAWWRYNIEFWRPYIAAV